MKKSVESFFVNCALGFESELANEITGFSPFLLADNARPHCEKVELEIDKGGVLVRCSFFLGLQINFFSHLANRVLWRVAEFKAKDIPPLLREFKKIDFSPLIEDSEIHLEVAAQKSRLNNEKKIAKVF